MSRKSAILVRQIPKVSGHVREYSRFAETVGGYLVRSRLLPTRRSQIRGRLQIGKGYVGCDQFCDAACGSQSNLPFFSSSGAAVLGVVSPVLRPEPLTLNHPLQGSSPGAPTTQSQGLDLRSSRAEVRAFSLAGRLSIRLLSLRRKFPFPATGIILDQVQGSEAGSIRWADLVEQVIHRKRRRSSCP